MDISYFQYSIRYFDQSDLVMDLSRVKDGFDP